MAWNGDKTTTAGRGDNDPVFAKLFHFLNVLDGELQLKNAVAGPDPFERGRGVCGGWNVPGNQQRGNRNVSVDRVSMEVKREKKTKPRNARNTPKIIRILSCLDRYLAVTSRARPTCIINNHQQQHSFHVHVAGTGHTTEGGVHASEMHAGTGRLTTGGAVVLGGSAVALVGV